MVELRGRGFSLRPQLFCGLRYDWSFDDYAERDLPCAAEIIVRCDRRPLAAPHRLLDRRAGRLRLALRSAPQHRGRVAGLDRRRSVVQAARHGALGPADPQLPLLAPSLDSARAGAGIGLLAPLAAADHPQPREPRRRHPAPDHGQHDRQLLAQRAVAVLRLDPERRLPIDRSAPRLSRRAPAHHRTVAVPGRVPRRDVAARRGQGHPRRHRLPPTSSSCSARARRDCASTTATSISSSAARRRARFSRSSVRG